MEVQRTVRRQTEPGGTSGLAPALTAVGSALFLLGVLHLSAEVMVSGYVDPVWTGDTTAVLTYLKLAGWFATAGWLLQYLPRIRSGAAVQVRKPVQRLQEVLTTPGDGILEILLGGIAFIVLVLIGMVSLWSGTIR